MLGSLVFVSGVLSKYVHSRKPSGEMIDLNVVTVIDPTSPGFRVRRVTVSLFISCTGPNCESYTVDTVDLLGYMRSTAQEFDLGTTTVAKPLKNGVTRVDVTGYYYSNLILEEVVVKVNICRGSSCNLYVKSVSTR